MVEPSTTTRAVVAVNVVHWGVQTAGAAGGGQWRERKGVGRVEYKQDQTPERVVVLALTLALSRSLLCTLACVFSSCFVFNCNPGGMAGLATSASISSFITWSACSGHRSLHGIRTLTIYTGARKSNLPSRRLLARTATITGAPPIPRVRLLNFTCFFVCLR